MNQVDIPRLLSDEETAVRLGVSPTTLAVWRCRKRYTLPWVKIGRRVRYREADVVAFINSSVVHPDLSPAA